MTNEADSLNHAIARNVKEALEEDIGTGDITAALIPADAEVEARILTRENAILCGRAWVDRVFATVDGSIELDWQAQDGDRVEADQVLLRLKGNARSMMTAERCALNFMQLLSGTATLCDEYAQRVAHTQVRLLDTRKTIPGLRLAQKYAVQTGGCHNHRIGLFDAFLIKENHIAACGSIAAAVSTARQHAPGKPVEVEVESFAQLDDALEADADRIMLDNFSVAEMTQAVSIVAGRAELEASGNIDESTLVPYAETGVDFISIGALTKHCRAIDLSMRLKGL